MSGAALAGATLVVGGGTYLLMKQPDPPASSSVPGPGVIAIPNPPPPYQPATSTGQTNPGATVGDLHGMTQTDPNARRMVPERYRVSVTRALTNKATAWPSHENIDPELQAKYDLLDAAAQKVFDDMNEVSKAKAAEYLNKELKLDPPLNGHENWKEIYVATGAAVGGAIGGYYGGPVGAKIGALCGAYLNAVMYDWIEKNYDEIADWCKEKWGYVKEWVSDAYDTVSGWVSF